MKRLVTTPALVAVLLAGACSQRVEEVKRAAPELPLRFDLICDGTSIGRGTRLVPRTPSNVSMHARYKIDTSSMQWCNEAQDCSKLVSATPNLLVLQDSDDATSHFEISRLTGHFEGFVRSEVTDVHWEGACSAAQFSGLPAPKF